MNIIEALKLAKKGEKMQSEKGLLYMKSTSKGSNLVSFYAYIYLCGKDKKVKQTPSFDDLLNEDWEIVKVGLI